MSKTDLISPLWSGMERKFELTLGPDVLKLSLSPCVSEDKPPAFKSVCADEEGKLQLVRQVRVRSKDGLGVDSVSQIAEVLDWNSRKALVRKDPGGGPDDLVEVDPRGMERIMAAESDLAKGQMRIIACVPRHTIPQWRYNGKHYYMGVQRGPKRKSRPGAPLPESTGLYCLLYHGLGPDRALVVEMKESQRWHVAVIYQDGGGDREPGLICSKLTPINLDRGRASRISLATPIPDAPKLLELALVGIPRVMTKEMLRDRQYEARESWVRGIVAGTTDPMPEPMPEPESDPSTEPVIESGLLTRWRSMAHRVAPMAPAPLAPALAPAPLAPAPLAPAPLAPVPPPPPIIGMAPPLPGAVTGAATGGGALIAKLRALPPDASPTESHAPHLDSATPSGIWSVATGNPV